MKISGIKLNEKLKSKIIAFIVVYMTIGTLVSSLYKSSLNAPKGYPAASFVTGDIHDMVIIYSDSYHGYSERDFQVDDFLPFLLYYNVNESDPLFKKPVNWFGIDGFLFIALGRNITGRYFYPGFGSEPANKSDWEWLIEKWFRPGYDLDALEHAIVNASNTLGIENYPYKDAVINGTPVLKIVITVPYSSAEQDDWGILDGSGENANRSLDFSLKEDRVSAQKWFIDRFLSRWNENAHLYPHLQLAGFYWLVESIKEDEIEECKEWNVHVHEKGYRTYWIPYHSAHSWDRWAELGFDAASLQPNLFFDWRKLIKNQSTTIETDPLRVEKTAIMAKQQGLGVEFEIDDTIMYNDTSREFLTTHFYKYLDVGATEGYMNGFMVYYQAVQTFRHLSESSNDIDRQRYQLIWHFVRGTYTPSMH
ncbi:MAG: DUF4855 domain-containing protein [Promethearchaeota archaeon]